MFNTVLFEIAYQESEMAEHLFFFFKELSPEGLVVCHSSWEILIH